MDKNKCLYPEAVVKQMLLTAYKAGFESPMELIEEIVNEILRKGDLDSEMELFEHEQEF